MKPDRYLAVVFTLMAVALVSAILLYHATEPLSR